MKAQQTHRTEYRARLHAVNGIQSPDKCPGQPRRNLIHPRVLKNLPARIRGDTSSYPEPRAESGNEIPRGPHPLSSYNGEVMPFHLDVLPSLQNAMWHIEYTSLLAPPELRPESCLINHAANSMKTIMSRGRPCIQHSFPSDGKECLAFVRRASVISP